MLALSLAGCLDEPAIATGDSSAPLLVLAASDLQLALPEIAADFEAATGRSVRISFGSTGQLATQIEQGAPADVFLAADVSFIDRLAERNEVRLGSRRVYAIGRLVLTWPRGAGPLAGPQDLGGSGIAAIATANPEHAPYGRAARETLEAVGVWEAVRGRVVLAENVSQALQFVRSGNADAGLVALALVVGVPELEYHMIDDSLHLPLRQEAAVLSEANDPTVAAAFVDFVAGPEGQGVLRRYGFEDPNSLR